MVERQPVMRQSATLARIVAVPLLFVLLLAGCAPGGLEQSIQATVVAEMARRPAWYVNGDARGWTVRRQGAGGGLIWGTLHVGYSADTLLPLMIRNRFYAASDLTVEVALDRATQRLRALGRRMATADATADGGALGAALGALEDADRETLRGLVPDAAGRKLSLRGLAVLVRNRAVADEPGGPPTIGFVDQNLIAFARQLDKPVHALEEPVVVDQTLVAPNGPAAANLLRQQLARASTLRAMSAWVIGSYGRNEVGAALAGLVAWRSPPASLADFEVERDRLLTRRTAAWVPGLERILSEPGDHFVAVGAGHVLGEDGLVALLRARGWLVEPCRRDACAG